MKTTVVARWCGAWQSRRSWLGGGFLLACVLAPVAGRAAVPSAQWQGMAITASTPADIDASRAIAEYLLALRAVAYQEPPTHVIDRLARAIAADPRAAHLYYQRAVLLATRKSWDPALADLDRAIALEPAQLGYHLFRTKVLSAAGRVPEAIAQLVRLRAQFPRSGKIYFQLARLYGRTHQYPQLERTLQQYLRVRPDSLAALLALATHYAEQRQQPQPAIRYLRRALVTRPGHARANAMLAQLLMETKQPKAALQILLQAEQYGDGDVTISLQIAMLYYELRNYAESIRRIESIIVSHPGSDKLRYYLGVMYDESGDAVHARAAFTAVPVMSELFRDARLRLAVGYMQAGQAAAAEQMLRQGIALRKDIQPFYEYLASIQERAGRIAEAVQTLHAATRQFPNQPGLWFTSAMLLDRLERRREAVRDMQVVLRLDPKNVAALNYVGYMYAEWGRKLDEAEALLQSAVQLQPNDGHVIDSLAWLYYRKGDYEHARQLIEHAQRLSPNEPAVLRHCGQILLKQGDVAQARQYLERARALAVARNQPSDQEERALIEKLLKSLEAA